MDRVGVQAAEVKMITQSKFFFATQFLYYYDLHICRIVQCVYDGDSRRGTCARIETVIRCLKSTNEHCATDAPFVGELTLKYGEKEIYSDEPCFHQRFDEYFNKDGLCSFQDLKK